MPKVFVPSLRSSPPEFYAVASKLDADTNAKGICAKFKIISPGILCCSIKIALFLSRKFELFIKSRVHFTFCSCPLKLWSFHELQDATSQFGCQFDKPPIFQQYFRRFRLQHSSFDQNVYFFWKLQSRLIFAVNSWETILGRLVPLKVIFLCVSSFQDVASSFTYIAQ